MKKNDLIFMTLACICFRMEATNPFKKLMNAIFKKEEPNKQITLKRFTKNKDRSTLSFTEETSPETKEMIKRLKEIRKKENQPL